MSANTQLSKEVAKAKRNGRVDYAYVSVRPCARRGAAFAYECGRQVHKIVESKYPGALPDLDASDAEVGIVALLLPKGPGQC